MCVGIQMCWKWQPFSKKNGKRQKEGQEWANIKEAKTKREVSRKRQMLLVENRTFISVAHFKKKKKKSSKRIRNDGEESEWETMIGWGGGGGQWTCVTTNNCIYKNNFSNTIYKKQPTNIIIIINIIITILFRARCSYLKEGWAGNLCFSSANQLKLCF